MHRRTDAETGVNVVTPEVPEIDIPVGAECVRLHFLGQVSLPGGFPISGQMGETVASYTIRYANGKVKEVPLRNGIEVAQSNMVFEATRVDPTATAAQRALVFVKDWTREHYQALLFSVPVDGGKVASISCKLSGQQSPLLLFAITAERG